LEDSNLLNLDRSPGLWAKLVNTQGRRELEGVTHKTIQVILTKFPQDYVFEGSNIRWKMQRREKASEKGKKVNANLKTMACSKGSI